MIACDLLSFIIAGMKRGKRRRMGPAAKIPATVQPKVQPVRDRRLVPVNDGPLRARAANLCKQALAKLDKARAEWRRFEQEDRPSFAQWMAVNFGALLTAIRENDRLMVEHEAFFEEVDFEMVFNGALDRRRAYATVKKRHENPGEDEQSSKWNSSHEGAGAPEDDDDEAFVAGGGPDVPEKERRAAFDDLLRSVAGLDPKHISKVEYDEMFADFEATMFQERSPDGPPGTRVGGKAPARGDEGRLKEIYRLLVRRLHPDLRADGDASVAAIWHEVQRAYEGRNLERLETLLALTEMQGGTNGVRASLFQMRAALEEIAQALRSLRRSIQEARRDPAWGFSRVENHAALEKRIRRQLERHIEYQRYDLADLKKTHDRWSRPSHPPARKPKKQPKASVWSVAEAEGLGKDVLDQIQGELFGF